MDATFESRFESLRQSFGIFPDSYNQLLACGICAYCIRIVKRVGRASDIPEDIERLLFLLWRDLDDLRLQHQHGSDRADFSRLDLQRLEDRFEMLQDKSSAMSIFPRLSDASLETLLAR
jgi:hypothetical protein